MAWPRAITLALLSLVGCTSEPDAPTTQDTSSSTGVTTGSTGATGTTTGTTGEPTSGTTAADGCASHPPGDWAACQKGGLTDNSLCGWMEGSGNGMITCLSPQSGSFNVCGIRDCVDDCDCFAAPLTGDAVPSCRVVFGGGGTACVLYCANGQTCPDGMECSSGYCYWPN
ncbi:MAG TPA: hypothetical protein VGB85_22370 [Nannocystis sp.]|jgi:hypothetical protein